MRRSRTLTPTHWVYLLVHVVLVLLGLSVWSQWRGWGASIRASLVAAGITGWVVFVYVMLSRRTSDKLAVPYDLRAGLRRRSPEPRSRRRGSEGTGTARSPCRWTWRRELAGRGWIRAEAGRAGWRFAARALTWAHVARRDTTPVNTGLTPPLFESEREPEPESEREPEPEPVRGTEPEYFCQRRYGATHPPPAAPSESSRRGARARTPVSLALARADARWGALPRFGSGLRARDCSKTLIPGESFQTPRVGALSNDSDQCTSRSSVFSSFREVRRKQSCDFCRRRAFTLSGLPVAWPL